MADALARCGRPALTAHFAARAFDAQCLFECVRSWAGDCFVFGGIAGSTGAGGGVGGLHGVDAADEAPLALTLYLLDIMLFLGALVIVSLLSNVEPRWCLHFNITYFVIQNMFVFGLANAECSAPGSSATLSVFGAMILHVDDKVDSSSTTTAPASMLRSIDSESAFYAAIADLPATVFAANAAPAQSAAAAAGTNTSARISATIEAIGTRAAALFSFNHDDHRNASGGSASVNGLVAGTPVADTPDTAEAGMMHQRWIDARRAVSWARAIEAGDMRIGVGVGTEAHARAAAQSRADEAHQKQQALLLLQQQQQQPLFQLQQQQQQQRSSQIRVVAQPGVAGAGAGAGGTHSRRNSEVIVIVRPALPSSSAATLTPSSSAAALPALPALASAAPASSLPAASLSALPSPSPSPSPSSVDARLLAENQELQRRVIELTRRAFEAQKRADAAVEAAAAATTSHQPQPHAQDAAARQAELAAAAAVQPSGRLSVRPCELEWGVVPELDVLDLMALILV